MYNINNNYNNQNSISYMDGVPVKISEKYKPPQKVILPQSILQKLTNITCSQDVHQSYASPSLSTASSSTTAIDSSSATTNQRYFDYDFAFERIVIDKCNELFKLRERHRFERQHRIQEKEYEQQIFMDEQQKLLLTTVSYPSTDEISSNISDDSDNKNNNIDNDNNNNMNNDVPNYGSTRREIDQFNVNNVSTVSSNNFNNKQQISHVQFSPPSNQQQRFDSILIPIIMSDNSKVELRQQQQLSLQNSINKFINSNTNVTPTTIMHTINYSDFENDASSPFDSVELKTINDLDVLAQVLHDSATIKQNVNNNYNTEISNHIKELKQQHSKNIIHARTLPLPQHNNDDDDDDGQEQNLILNKCNSKSVPDILRELDEDLDNTKLKRNRNNSQCNNTSRPIIEEKENKQTFDQ